MINSKALQYRQIDFLRLFRLCKKQGIVKRKRNLPSQYDSISDMNLSCHKLFKNFVVAVFKDWDVKFNTKRKTYTIMVPYDVSSRLQFIDYNRSYLDANEDILRRLDANEDILRRLAALSLTDGINFISSIDLYNYSSLIINVIPAHGRYRNVVSEIGNDNERWITRPREEYYRCAKSCLEYKALLDEHIGVLCSFVDNYKEEINRARQERLGQIERDRLVRLQELEEANRISREQQARRVAEQAQRAHNENRARSQQLFNEALMSRRGGAR